MDEKVNIENLNEFQQETDQKLKHQDVIKRCDTFFLYFVVLSAQLIQLTSGATLSWTSPALIMLESNDTKINPLGKPITPIEVSMISGPPTFISLVATLFLGKLSDIVGRKRNIQIAAFLLIIGSGGLAFSNQVIYIMISRSCNAIGLVSAHIVLVVYITEICEDHNRTKYCCFLGLFIQIGFLFGFVTGSIFSFRNLTLIINSPSVCFLIFSLLCPESPVFLLSQGKEKECKTALKKLRNNKTETELHNDFLLLQQSLKSVGETKNKNQLSMIIKRENRYALLFALLPVMVQLFSGMTVLMSFLAPVFDSAGTNLSGNNAAILISLVKIFCFFFTSLVIGKFGRFRMLLISSVGTGMCLFILGVYFYLKHVNSSLINHLQWLPITGFISLVIIYGLGLGLIPGALICELFTSDYRAVGTSIITTAINVSFFILNITFPLISSTFGNHCLLFMFGLLTLIGSLIIYLYLPDIEGKSLQQIQEILKAY